MPTFVCTLSLLLYNEGFKIMIYDLQRASLVKRFSAFLLDFVLMAMLFTGAMLIVSSMTGYDTHFNDLETRLTEIQEQYNIPAIEEETGIYFNKFQLLSEEERLSVDEKVYQTYTECTNALTTDAKTIKLYETVLSLSILIVSISMLITFLILEFIVPLILKNGQTVGKKVFSIAVMRIDAVKISPTILFIRTILGKYTIGTMVPIVMVIMLLFGSSPIIISIAIVLLILLLQIILLFTTKTRSLIQDYLASTVVVDFQSQMIFDSVEAKQEYQLRLHKEAAEKASY